MMKISVSSDPLDKRLGLDYMFSVASQAGIDGIDLDLNYITWKQVKQNDFSPFICDYDKCIEFSEKVNELCEEYNLEILQTHAPFPTWYEDVSDEINEKLNQTIRNAIYITKAVGCKYCVVHPYFFPFTSDRQNSSEEIVHELNIKLYSHLIPALKDTGVICCLENMWIPEQRYRGKGHIYSSILENPYEVNRYVDELNELAGEEMFGFCFDTGHAVLSGYDPCKVMTLIKDKIRVLHVHDNNGIDDSHYIPYIGIIDWDRFCQTLKDIGYSAHLNFETGGFMNKFTPDPVKRDRAMDLSSFK